MTSPQAVVLIAGVVLKLAKLGPVFEIEGAILRAVTVLDDHSIQQVFVRSEQHRHLAVPLPFLF